MALSAATGSALHEPENELYDHGCDLVQAARAIRTAAGSARATRAIPAVLGCFEAALEELLWAAALLEEAATRAVPRQATNARADRLHRGYANLQRALDDAEVAAAAARALTARALGPDSPRQQRR
jgi:hypothetical protein